MPEEMASRHQGFIDTHIQTGMQQDHRNRPRGSRQTRRRQPDRPGPRDQQGEWRPKRCSPAFCATSPTVSRRNGISATASSGFACWRTTRPTSFRCMRRIPPILYISPILHVAAWPRARRAGGAASDRLRPSRRPAAAGNETRRGAGGISTPDEFPAAPPGRAMAMVREHGRPDRRGRPEECSRGAMSAPASWYRPARSPNGYATNRSFARPATV